MRRNRVVIGALGVILLAAAGVTRLVVLPAVSKLPANSDTTNVYTGTAETLLNEAGLMPGTRAPAVLRDLPLRITESVRVLKASSSAAVVDYRRVEKVPGQSLPVLDNHYAVDRRTLAASTAISAADVTTTHGLTISFPIGTRQQNYTGWVQDTATTTSLRFSGTATSVQIPTSKGPRIYQFGLRTDRFTASVPTEPITDRQELAAMPSSVPKSLFATMLTRMDLSSAVRAELLVALPKLPSIVPLTYTYSGSYAYWVAPADGIVVDLLYVENRSVELPATVLGSAVPITTVSQFVYTDSLGTFLARDREAKSDATKLALVGTDLPLSGLIAGLLLSAVAAWLSRRRRSTSSLPDSGVAQGEPLVPLVTGRQRTQVVTGSDRERPLAS
jgi:Porin PorA